MTATLRRSDLSAALEFVREAGHLPDSQAFRRHVVDQLPRLVPTTMISYNDISPEGDLVLLLDPLDAWTEQRERDFVRLAGEHPLISHYQRTGDPLPRKISDFMGRREFHQTEIYRTVYGPMGVEYQMAVTLPAAPGGVVGIALNRDRRDFGERDRAMLELLRPHLAQLRRDAAARDAARLLESIVDRTLGDRGRSAVAVGRGGIVAFASAGALDLIASYVPQWDRADLLPEVFLEWRRRERARGLAPSRDLVIDGPEGRLLARLLPSAEPTGHDVILLDDHRVGASLLALAGLGLSVRQAEILLQVARGRTNAQVAAALHVSPRTVQKHLENIYDRLGVRSRAAATARAVTAIAGGPGR
jgi:DNA-binding CsgD family transcriptional regulator